MAKNTLLQLKSIISANELLAAGFVRNSQKVSGNLYLHITCRVYTDTNTTEVYYTIYMFRPHDVDSYKGDFQTYQEAVAKYNELLIKFNGYQADPE